jgi:hypothetical protein
VAFFSAWEDPNRLILRHFFNARQPAPRNLKLNDSNTHLGINGMSLARLVWRTGKIVIVPDTVKELERPQWVSASFS